MSEKKFEWCTLGNATHVEVNGVRHELNDNVLYFRNGDLLGMSWRDEYTYISEELFSTLGIKPLKEIKPEPIEFEFIPSLEMAKDSWLGEHIPMEAVGKKFCCVEILEDEE